MFKYWFMAVIFGFILDMAFGDPQFLYHPIRLVGKLIQVSEKGLRGIFKDNEKGLKMAGFFLVVIVCAFTAGTVFLIDFFAYGLNVYLGVLTESILCYFMLAAKSLKTESMKVYDRIRANDTKGARNAVSMIVGRDTENLSNEGIIKAAVETVAENLSDGVIAPLIFMFVGGSVLGAFYKAVNTMDSMVGYKNDKYVYFGRCAAMLDDIVNFVPSRISALLLIFAAFILKKDYKNAWRIFKRDRFNHASPNSAQTEAACAGALGIQLAGDAFYFGRLYKKPFIGDKINDVRAENIVDINNMMYVSSIAAMVIFCGLYGVFAGGVFR